MISYNGAEVTFYVSIFTHISARPSFCNVSDDLARITRCLSGIYLQWITKVKNTFTFLILFYFSDNQNYISSASPLANDGHDITRSVSNIQENQTMHELTSISNLKYNFLLTLSYKNKGRSI